MIIQFNYNYGRVKRALSVPLTRAGSTASKGFLRCPIVAAQVAAAGGEA
jgi:hypothetical protein